MSFPSAERSAGSVAPPGFVPSASIAPATAPPAEDRASPATVPPSSIEAALGWRINAAIVDNVIVYGMYAVLCAVLHWRVVNAAHLLVLVLGGVAYHWAFEARDGQTIGKGLSGIRVVSVDGGRAPASAIAWRSVLRIADQIPVAYLSGLINIVRTGPERRQRIGDVAGRTLVVAVGGRALEKGTGRWVLPTATLIATLASALTVFSAVNSGNASLSDRQRAEFVAGCQSRQARIDCGCLLSSLEARGYDSLNSIGALEEREREALAAGDRSAIPVALTDSARACLR